MDICYERYLNDKSRYLDLNGYTYSKIIERSEFHVYPGFSLLIIYEPLENVQIGDILMDEKGREFTIEHFDMMRFGWGIPQWAYKLIPICISGESYDIGEYLCKKKS